MTSEGIFQKDGLYVMQTYPRNPVAIKSGSGATLIDFEGRRYIDFTSGIGVNSVGYSNPKWVAAVAEQAKELAHISNLFYTLPGTLLAEKLCNLSGMDKVFFSNSGAEANEGMIKLARKYSFDKYGDGRSTIITLRRSFHGRTITTLSATGQDNFHKYFGPFTEGFRYARANDLEDIAALDDSSVCAVMIEPVQGEGGVLPLDPDYVRSLEALCREKDWLLLVDEVQTGIGRTGKLFACEHYGISPDVISFAKGIAGGLPLGGFLASKKVSSVLGAGTHATTFGANPICCAAALSVLDILINDGVLDTVEEKGTYIRKRIEALGLPTIKGTRGLGLMIGVEIIGAKPSDIAKALINAGLLVLTAGTDAIRLLPPLTISYEEIDKGLEILQRTISRL
jgi:acetylornithine/N-succinyldiaminopimelate aminotransferase